MKQMNVLEHTFGTPCGHMAMKTTGFFLSMRYLWTGDWERKQGLPQTGNGLGSSRPGHLFLPTLPFHLTHLKATQAAHHHLDVANEELQAPVQSPTCPDSLVMYQAGAHMVSGTDRKVDRIP